MERTALGDSSVTYR